MGRSTNTTSGRPDSKTANITSIEGQNGLVVFAVPNANKPTYKHSDEVRRNLTNGYIENGVELYNIVDCEAITGLQLLDGNTYFRSNVSPIPNNTPTNINGEYSAYVQSNTRYYKPISADSTSYINILIANDVTSDFTVGNTYKIIYTKKSPYLVTSGNQLHTDLVGDPSPYNSTDATYISPTSTSITDMPTNTLVWDNATGKMYKTIVDTNDLDANGLPVPAFTDTTAWTQVNKGYPVELRNRLASGVGDNLTANLVDDSGTSNIPDGTKTTFKITQKVTSQLQVTKSTDAGVTWTVETVTFDSINNTITFSTAPEANSVVLVSNSVANQPAISISTPQPIQTVDRNLIASNSHSIYAYNGLTYASSGKVATGSSVESKYAEDVVVEKVDVVLNCLVETTVKTGDRVSIYNNNYNNDGIIYTRIGADFTATLGANSNIKVDGVYWDYKITPPTPTHSPITLDNQSIVASKALLTQTSNATQVFTEEMIWDSTNNDFGDTGQFDQLIAGTTTDWNSNTVQTKVLLKPSSILLGDK